MTDLVLVSKKEVWTDSRIMAEKLTRGKHAYVKDVIKNIVKKIEKYGRDSRPYQSLKYIKKESIYRNQKFEYYLLNKQMFSMVAMKFRTDEAFEWQVKFIDAFFNMEKAISRQQNLEWIESRNQGKLARKQETDIIKEYVDYATNQGSKNATKYYIHLTKATYKALGLLEHNKPATRDMLDTLQIYQIVMAEMVVSTSLRKYMALGVSYKQIFQLVKDDLDQYSGLIDMTGIKQLAVKP